MRGRFERWTGDYFGWIAGLVVFAAVLWIPAVFNDGDTLWHIRAGEWMLAHLAVPRVDVFSYTAAGWPWVTHEWLAEVLLALVYRAGGWSGVMALTAGAMGLTAGLLSRHLRYFAPPKVALPLLVLALACLLPSLLARPHLLAFPCLEFWCASLLIARARDAAPSPWLLPLMTLWANLHGGFMVGVVLVAIFGLEAAWQAGAAWGVQARRWGLFLAGTILAALLTPHFLEGLLFPFQLLGLHGLDHITEWKPASVGLLSPFVVSVLLLLYLGASGRIRMPLYRALLLTGVVFAAFHHARNEQLFAIIGALLIASSASFAGAGTAAPLPRLAGFRVPRFVVPALSAVALLALAVRLAVPFVRQDSPVYPATALAHVPAKLRALPVLNGYGIGGYLIFAGVRPFIDGRADLYGGKFLHTYLEADRPDPAVLDRVLRRYRIAWAIFPPHDGALMLLDRRPGWRRLYTGKYAVVDVRDAALPR